MRIEEGTALSLLLLSDGLSIIFSKDNLVREIIS